MKKYEVYHVFKSRSNKCTSKVYSFKARLTNLCSTETMHEFDKIKPFSSLESLPHYWLDQGFDGTVVNRTCPYFFFIMKGHLKSVTTTVAESNFIQLEDFLTVWRISFSLKNFVQFEDFLTVWRISYSLKNYSLF